MSPPKPYVETLIPYVIAFENGPLGDNAVQMNHEGRTPRWDSYLSKRDAKELAFSLCHMRMQGDGHLKTTGTNLTQTLNLFKKLPVWDLN